MRRSSCASSRTACRRRFARSPRSSRRLRHGTARRRQQSRGGDRHRRGAAGGRPGSRLARPDRALAQRRRARAAVVQARARAQRNAVLGEPVQNSSRRSWRGPSTPSHTSRKASSSMRTKRGPTCWATRTRKGCSALRSWIVRPGSKAALKGALVACGRGQWSGESIRVSATTAAGEETAARAPAGSDVRRRRPGRQAQRATSGHRDPRAGGDHRASRPQGSRDGLLSPAAVPRGIDGSPRCRRRPRRARARVIRPDKFRELEEQIGPLRPRTC